MRLDVENYFALILGGSSGFGLAAAKELAKRGMGIIVVHRDRQGAMHRIQREFDEVKSCGVNFYSFNLDALSRNGMEFVLKEISSLITPGKIRVLLHSIAFGSLKLIVPRADCFKHSDRAISQLAKNLDLSFQEVQLAINQVFNEGGIAFHSIATPPSYDDELLLLDEELLQTIYAMGASILSWTKALFSAGLFAKDSRVIGLTSEGNEVAWRGYAAVSAAKACLESISKSIAAEYGVHGIRSNIIQPGITCTPALKLIPGSSQLMARAELRNPLGRLTQTEDVAKVISLMASDEAAWINGSVIRVDGGERISGL